MDRLSLPGAISVPNAAARRTTNAASAETTMPVAGKGATGIPADSLVRQASAPAASNLNGAVAAAELRLAQAYDADPKTFAHNLARLSLQELASNIA